MSEPDAATGPADDRLRDLASTFAAELHDVLCRVLPSAVPPLVVWRDPRPGRSVRIAHLPAAGVPLTVDGTVVLRLRMSFHCAWDRTGRFLAVGSSRVDATAEGTEEPLFRYDFDARTDARIPAAHLNVHGHRDELVFAMMAAGARHRGRARASGLRRGRVPRVATLHFPLGGHRFRPAFEDVLEMLVREFGLDTREGWREALAEGRRRWRDVQLRAAVRDEPATAAAVLGDLGWSVSGPEPGGVVPDRPRQAQ